MKRVSCFVLVALLCNSTMHPAFNINAGKDLLQKGTAWVANTVPWWVPWVSAVLFCGAQWQRYHTKWQASEARSQILEQELRKTKEQLQSVKSDNPWENACKVLGIQDPKTVIEIGMISLNPEKIVLIGSEGLVYNPGNENTPPELEIHAEICPEELRINTYLKDQQIPGVDPKISGGLKPFPLVRKHAFVLTKEWFDLSANHPHCVRYGWPKV